MRDDREMFEDFVVDNYGHAYPCTKEEKNEICLLENEWEELVTNNAEAPRCFLDSRKREMLRNTGDRLNALLKEIYSRPIIIEVKNYA